MIPWLSLAFADPSPPSHCAPTETVAFTCVFESGKVASLCRSGATAAYRIGKPGAVELTVPASPAPIETVFQSKTYPDPLNQRNVSSVEFGNGGYTYSFWSDPKTKLIVTAPDGKVVFDKACQSESGSPFALFD